MWQENELVLSSSFNAQDSYENSLVFFKPFPVVITMVWLTQGDVCVFLSMFLINVLMMRSILLKDNFQDTLLTSSLSKSPVTTLFHAVQKVYAPLLLKSHHILSLSPSRLLSNKASSLSFILST